MKKWIIVLCIAAVLLILFAIYGYMNKTPTVVSADIPSSDIITKHYLREDFAAAKACFEAWAPFRSVYIEELCDLFEFKAQCKRMVNDDSYYYVLADKNNAYHCFIFTDRHDEIRQVLVVKDFPSIAQLSSDYKMYGKDFVNLWEYQQTILFAEKNIICILSDGVAILPDDTSDPDMLPVCFNDEEWLADFRKYEGVYIYPIDKKAD